MLLARLLLFLPLSFPLVVAGLVSPLTGQCQSQWLPGNPLAWAAGAVAASTQWDPDGTGPAAPLLVAGGDFAVAEADGVDVAAFDGTTWTPMPTGAGAVRALATHGGQLFAAAVAGSGGTVSPVYVRTGAGWTLVGQASGDVRALCSYNGLLIAAGWFSSIGGVPANGIAAWNGSSWAPLGSGIQGTARALTVWNGALHVGGTIVSAGGVPCGNLAVWNGSSWTAGPFFNGTIESFATRLTASAGNSYLFVGGAFTQFTIGTTTTAALRIARSTALAGTWSAFQGGLPGVRCTTLAVRATGLSSYELVAGVEHATPTQRLWRSTGGAFSTMGVIEDETHPVTPQALSFHGGRWVVGTSLALVAARAWDGTQWRALEGQGVPATVYAVLEHGGAPVAGGAFATIGGTVVNGIARRVGDSWLPLGTGVEGGLGVFALCTAANGDLVAGGDFTTAGGQQASRIARWNGATWAPLGGGLDGTVQTLLALPDGGIVAAGDFTAAGGVSALRVARWNGSAWAPMGQGFPARVNALALLPNGDIVAGGNFLQSGSTVVNRIARWDGVAWQPLGSGCNGIVYALAAAPDGTLHVGGAFTSAGGIATRIARWNAGTWSPTFTLGVESDVYALAVHPAGDLIVGGGRFSFSLGPLGGFSSHVVRLAPSGTQWSLAVDGGPVFDLAIAGGDVLAGGAFTRTGPVLSGQFARLGAPCPATALPVGAGCAGLTADLSLTTTQAPWAGATYRSRAATFGPAGLALHLFGFTPIAVPLPLLLAEALPGCDLLTTPDLLEVLLPVQGVVTFATTVPNDPSLAGVQFREQVLQYEFGAGGTVAGISSSNAMALTIGVFL